MPNYDVLIVDDQQDIRFYISSILKEQGLDVRSVSGGTEALEVIRRERPVLAIIDLVMPGIPGDELCRLIKEDPALQDILVVMLSARADVESKLKCFQAGAEEYLVKPVDGRELAARVNRFLRMALEREGRTCDRHLRADRTPTGGKTPPPPFKPMYGSYRVEHLVTSGGMGRLLKGRDEVLEREVAIKVLSPLLTSSDEFINRFHREARVLASINHPGIAAIYSFGEQDGEHYFAMQWCSGGSVADLLRKHGQIAANRAVDIIIECSEALHAASKKAIVHRDIKPGNLMFDEEGKIRIVDFGIAYSADGGLTHAGEILGTPNYMSPEQARTSNVDFRADIYSLGITMYYMIYGRLPYRAASPVEMVMKHATEPFPEYDSANGRVPKEVYRVIGRMTEKRPEDRYDTYPALVEDLLALKKKLVEEKRQQAVSLPDIEEIRNQIPDGVLIEHETGFESILHRLELTPQQSFIASRVENSGLTLADLELMTGLPEQTVLQTVWLLRQAGAVQYTIPIALSKKPRREKERKPERLLLQQPPPPLAPQQQEPQQKQHRQPKTPATTAAASATTATAKMAATPTVVTVPSDPLVRMEVLRSKKEIEVSARQRAAEQLFRLAEERYEEGDYYHVTSFCRQAIGLCDSEPKYYLLAARAFARHPRFVKDAQLYFEKACELDAWNADIRVELAEFYLDQKLPLRAVGECKKALMTAPEHEGARSLLDQLKKARAR